LLLRGYERRQHEQAYLSCATSCPNQAGPIAMLPFPHIIAPLPLLPPQQLMARAGAALSSSKAVALAIRYSERKEREPESLKAVAADLGFVKR
jgi:hypothetical protein